MRHSCRFHFLLTICVVLFVIAGAQARAFRQHTDALPKVWNDLAAELADIVAAMVSPAHPVNFEFVNVSGLGAAGADAARAALEAQLAHHHFRIARSANADTALRATLAESSENYVWTVEIRQKDSGHAEPQVAIVTLAKNALPNDSGDGQTVTLKSQLVWKQAKRFLDFRLIGGDPAPLSRLFVLEPSLLEVYDSKNFEWELQNKIAISRSKPWPRDVRGYLKGSDDKIAFAMPGISCTQTSDAIPAVKCEPGPEDLATTGAPVPGTVVGEAVNVGLSCGDARAMVASSVGDWTQADSLQGYIVRNNQAFASGVASGTAVAFDGPVVSLVQDAPGTNAVRAVVRNLKTGNYEGYLVTASCSQ